MWFNDFSFQGSTIVIIFLRFHQHCHMKICHFRHFSRDGSCLRYISTLIYFHMQLCVRLFVICREEVLQYYDVQKLGHDKVPHQVTREEQSHDRLWLTSRHDSSYTYSILKSYICISVSWYLLYFSCWRMWQLKDPILLIWKLLDSIRLFMCYLFSFDVFECH